MRNLLSIAFAVLALSPSFAQLRCIETDASIEVTRGEHLVLRYLKKPSADAAANDPLYTRTGYIHPLCTPSGKVITGDYAPDHPHQHGLFFAWTKTSFDGRHPEFWNQKQGSGRVSYESTIAVISGEEGVGFDVVHRYDDLTAGAEPVAVLRERWQVRVRFEEGRYLLDLASEQSCVGEKPLVIEKYHYGGMAIRGNAAWLGKDPAGMVTSEGKDRVAGNHTRPAWVKMAGELDGQACGIVAIPHPDNFRAPQWVRLHPEKPYFVFSPMVEEPFTIQPEQAYRSRFRWVIYDGKIEDTAIAAAEW